jgi:hypothetical protein
LTVKTVSIGKDVRIKAESTVETLIKPITQGLIDLIKDSALKGLDPDAIILDASVVLKIRKHRKTDPNEGRRIIQSILNAVDSDDTILTDKKGQHIQKNAVKESKEVRITFITDNFLDEVELEHEMQLYLKEL